MPPKLSYGLNIPKQTNKLSALGGSQTKSLAGQKRKKTIFDDSDSEGEQQEGPSRNDDNSAIEITTLGGLDGQDLEEEEKINKDAAPRKAPRSTGLSLSSAKPPNARNGSKPFKASIFDDENDEGQQQDQQPKPTKKFGLQTSEQHPTDKNYINLAALHSSRKYAKEAEAIDPSIYSYDAVYDSIKAKREKPSKANANGDGDEGSSKYMDALMRSAEVRKRDQMRARDRLLAKEREAEGDEFADKEKFVTAAYRAQQEEVKRMEEEEAQREKEEEERRRKNGGSGMMGFYRQMLARDEESHGEVMKAAEEAARKVAAGEVPTTDTATEASTGEKTEAQIAAELNSRGAKIIVNDEGQVVDKRQLLSAGLNVAPPKPKAKPTEPTRTGPSTTAFRPGGARAGGPSVAARDAQRARQTEMVAAQLEEKARQEEEAEKARQKELAEKNRSRKTESDVSSARERYLARKREREAQAQNQG
ncbi:hypothetical protein UA08_03631 [Talaromyces atroroseus]|uniref:Nuclear speckle splicing regulatory protein 1 N-terminal domain-containing protein n=1 Tax=Talaromyces atroroseus TaxID=1441469 RepID=A0A225B0J4_TALAT|nr:hypothetical protein UA08_03631 [Talaromyces atroroseus]OKL61489.1 hypothetical protein UA08_03631 [Talaromyces atroroseus]